MRNTKYTSKGFSIIEVLVGIFVFSMGLVSIYALLASALGANEYNKNSIIASYLAREQVELLRNIRDTNYKKLNPWNQRNPESSNFNDVFSAGRYYLIENNLSVAASFSTELTELPVVGVLPEGKSSIGLMDTYRLCMDSDNMYTHDCSTGNEKTPFYRYLYIDDKDIHGSVIGDDAYRVISKVIWYKRGYHEFDIQTLITDWRRI